MVATFLLDSMIYDRISNDVAFFRTLKFAIKRGVVGLLKTHVQEDQLSETPCQRKRARLLRILQQIPHESVDTAAAAWDVSAWDRAEWGSGEADEAFKFVLGNTKPGSRKHAADALLATTAFQRASFFVTEDSSTRRRAQTVIAARGLFCRVLDFTQFKSEVEAKRATRLCGL